jgi:hypothetical protein
MRQAQQRQIRQRLTYANVISSLALFLVLSGGAAFAASKIGSGNIKANAIKSKQLARNSVTSSKIKPGSIQSNDIALGAIGAQQLAANSVDGSKVPDGSLSASDLSSPPGPVLGVTPVAATTVATATGGPVTVPTGGEEEEEGEEGEEEGEEAGAAQIPLTGGTFTQAAQENIIYLAQVEATLSAEEGEECGIEVTVNVDGQPLGPTVPANLPVAPEEEEEEEGEEEEGEEEEGEEEEAPATPTTVAQGRVLGPNLATGTAQPRVMTAEAIIGEDAVCESAEVKSLKIIALGLG